MRLHILSSNGVSHSIEEIKDLDNPKRKFLLKSFTIEGTITEPFLKAEVSMEEIAVVGDEIVNRRVAFKGRITALEITVEKEEDIGENL